MDNTGNNEWITVANAARILDVSKQAIRQRIYRGTIPHRKDPDGTVFVRIMEHNLDTNCKSNAENNQHNDETNADILGETDGIVEDRQELIDELRDRLAFVERQLEQANERDRENRRIIAGLVQRVPELEAAPEPREAPVSASDNGNRGEPPPDTERRSWWRRWFGFE